MKKMLRKLSKRSINRKSNHSKSRSSRILRFENFESRLLLAVVNWDGGGGDLQWENPLNWSGDTLPGVGDDVVINVSGDGTVLLSSGGHSVKSVQSNQSLTLSWHSLTVAETIQVDKVLTLTQITLTNATIIVPEGGALRIAGGVLDSVTINGNSSFDYGGHLSIRNGLTLNGQLTMGEWNSSIIFYGTQSLEGTGVVSLSHATSNLRTASADTTLTIGSGITVRGGGVIGGDGAIVNQGTIIADTPNAITYLIPRLSVFLNQGSLRAINGGTLHVERLENQGVVSANDSSLILGWSWSNSGTITATNSSTNLGGIFKTDDLSTFQRTGGAVKLSGRLDNSGRTLLLNSARGSWDIDGGTILGGILDTADESLFKVKQGTFDGVTVDGELRFTDEDTGSLRVLNGLTLNGRATLPSRFGSFMIFEGSQSLMGTGEVLVSSESSPFFLASGLSVSGSNMTLTIGAGITVRGGNGAIIYGFAAAGNISVINYGTILADQAGRGLVVRALGNGTVVNHGTMRAVNGGTLQIDQLNNQGTITAVESSLVLDGNWSNSGTITATSSSTRLGGAFTTAGLGTFNRIGGEVVFVGTLDNRNSTLAFNSTTGSWNMTSLPVNSIGKVIGGVISMTEGEGLNFVYGENGPGILDAVTLNGDLTLRVPQGVSVRNGLVLNGQLTLAERFSHLQFEGTQIVGGNGSIVFGNIDVGLTVRDNDTALTIGPGITIRGVSDGLIWSGGIGSISAFTNVSVINQGQIVGDLAGQRIQIVATGTGTVVNEGVIRSSGGGSVQVVGNLSIPHPGSLRSGLGSSLSLEGSFVGDVNNPALFDLRGRTTIAGGTPAAPRLLEVMSRDRGGNATAYTNNFAFGSLALQPNSYVRLVDFSDNSAGTDPEVLYADVMIVPTGASLDLNGKKLYARAVQVDGQIVNGTVEQIADSGPLSLAVPTPGQISIPGELDEWTFFGRAGRALSALLNASSSSTPGSPAPVSPQLLSGQISLLDPAGTVLATANATTSGQILALSGITLPSDGTYRIQVRAATGQSGRTGNYVIGAYDVTADVAPLLLNQQTLGQIGAPFNSDRWTFSLSAGQQVRFDLINSSTSGLLFTLEGPDGYRPFENLTGDSELITIPVGRTGIYTLVVRGSADQSGSYSFAVRETTLVDLPLATPTSGSLAGDGSAVLYRVQAPGGTPLLVTMDHSVNSDRTEIYLRRGVPPTRAEFDHRFSAPGPDHSLLVPNASPGEWFVLVCGDRVAEESSFTIRATASDIYLLDTTPDQVGTDGNVTMTLTGAGFLPGLEVELVSGDTVISAQSVEVDGFDRATASFNLVGVTVGSYDVRVRTAGGTDTLAGALTVTQPGQGRLETRIIAPPNLGRHELATIFVEYANVGNAPIPAPIIQLRSADPDNSDRPILTLDQTRISQGLWTSNLPEGFGHSVTFLGGGAQPGLLNPGERVQIPVYYAGLLAPWDFSDFRVELGLSIIEADNNRPMNWWGKTYVQVDEYQESFGGCGNCRAVSSNSSSSSSSALEFPPSGDWYRGTELREVDWLNGNVPTNSELRPRLGLPPKHLDKRFYLIRRYDEPGVLQSRPEAITAEAWNAIIENLQHSISTFGDWMRVLNENAQFLARSGIVTNDLNDLWGFEVMQAMGSLGPVQTLDAVTDATMPVPGIELSLSRSFINGITSRYTSGPFGQGWNMGWDLLLTEKPGPTPQLRGSVVLSTSNGQRQVFEPDSRDLLGRKYFSPVGDSSTLTKLSSGLFELRDQNGVVTRFRADGRMDYVQDTNGNRVTTTFDSDRLTALTHSSGASIALTYNPAGRITQVADSAGRTTNYTYDDSNTYLLTVTTDDGKVTTYTYNQTGSPQVLHALRSITSGGATQFFNYDTQGRLDDTFRGNNQQFIDMIYDTAGTVSVADAAGVTRLFYQQDGLLARVTDPLGNTTVSRFDENYRINAIIAPTGESQSFTWCDCGSLTSITDELGNRTSFTYDNPFRRMTSFTDALGRSTHYTYDTRGNLQQTIYPNGTVESLGGYDAQGLPASFTNRRGQAQSLTYTTAGQVDRQTFADGSYADFDYDTRGNLILITEVGPGGTGTAKITTYTYDYASNGDRLKRMTDAEGRWLEYSYDGFGRRAAMTDQTGYVTRYEYDQAGRLHRLLDGADTLLVTYSYDPAGRLSRVDKGNGTFTTYTYDVAGQLLNLVNHRNVSQINSRFDYTYDARGRRTSMSTLDGDWSYTYDATGQLTRAVFASADTNIIPNQDLQYVYDAVGNRIRTILNGVTTEYTTNNLNQYTNVGGQAYTYDADGNLTFDGQRTYVYDQQNRLIRVTGPAGVTEYEYDALGNRTATIHNGIRTEYLLDPTGLVDVMAEFDGNGTLTARNVHGLGLIGRSIAGNALNYFDFDAIGSTAGITGAAGQLLNRYVYEPFGATIEVTESVVNSLRFLGQHLSSVTDGTLARLGARHYDQSTGRFVSHDPLRIDGNDANLYRYAANNPISFVDPFGLTTYVYEQSTGKFYSSGFNATGYSGQGVGYNNPGENDRPYRPGSGHYGPIPTGEYTLGPPILNKRGNPDFNLKPTDDTRRSFPSQRQPNTFKIHGDNSHRNRTASEGCIILDPEIRRKLRKGDVIIVIPGLPPGDTVSPTTVNSVDPNDKLGPQGVGTENFVRGDAALPYRIRFENIGPGSINPGTNEPFPQFRWATAPAQRVTILDQLSPLLDWSTFRLTELGFGDTIIAIPPDRSYYEGVTIVTINGQTFNVELFAGIDLETGRVFAAYQSLDPNTGLPPDVLTGFLPPEDGTGVGMGYFAFTIQPVAGLATGTEIRNVALISFDNQTIIATNQADPFDPESAVTDPADPLFGRLNARNTIDAGVPTSAVEALPAVTENLTFLVTWQGDDDPGGVGVADYDVYVSENNGPFQLWLQNTSLTSAAYVGRQGATYGFVSQARDQVGNRESLRTVADSTTLVNVPPTIELQNVTSELHEATSTAADIHLAEIALSVADNGPFTLSLSGPDAAYFRLVNQALYLKSGTELNAFLKPSYAVTIAVDDLATAAVQDASVDYVLQVIGTPIVLQAHPYYANSVFSAGGNIAAAVDTSKSLARESSEAQTLGFDNLINTSSGINGLVFDIRGLPATSLTASDFEFQWSPQGAFGQAANPPSSWAVAPEPAEINILANQTSRVVIEWPDQTIMNRWLRVTVKANGNTGLAQPEVYYLGHLQGETTGASEGRFAVRVADILQIRSALNSPANVSSIVDLDKSGIVRVADILASRSNLTKDLTQITIGSAFSAASIVASHVYHKGSSYAAGGTNVAAALDTGKALAKEGATSQQLGFNNLINTTRGINGLVFDIANLAASSLTANDFIFQMSPQGVFNESANPPASWQAAPTPTSISILPGSSPARVVIEWPDNAIKDRWLRVTIKANLNTGLATPEVYYLGHLQGKTTGPSSNMFTVRTADIAAIRLALTQSATISSNFDLDKSGLVRTSDIAAARIQLTKQIPQITIPAAGGGGGGGLEEGSGEETVELGDDNGLMFSSFSTAEQAALPTPSLRTLESDQETAVGLVYSSVDSSAVSYSEEPVSKPAVSTGEVVAVPSGSDDSDSSVGSLEASAPVPSMNPPITVGTSSGVVLVGGEVLQDLSSSLQLPVRSNMRSGSRSAPPIMPSIAASPQPQQFVETARNLGSIPADLSTGTRQPDSEGIDHDPQSIRDALFGRLATPVGSPARAVRPSTKAEKLRSVDQFFEGLSDDNQ